MNQIATQGERTPMDSVSVSNTSTGSKMAPQNLAEVVKFAEVMCRADIALPKHLRGNAGACMAVALQALEWNLSPFAVASKSYAVNGAIAYEAQLIAAVVNTRSGIKGRLKYSFEGEGGALTCTVTGVLDGEECVYKSPTIGSITTKNSPLWKSDPQQQLGYFSARSWARRHCPEVILGVYDRDEAESFRGPDNAKDITTRVIVDPLSDEPIQQQRIEQTDVEFDRSTGEIFEQNSDLAPSGPDTGADTPRQEPAEAEVTAPTTSASPSIPEEMRVHFIEFAKKAFRNAVDKDLTADKRIEFIKDMEVNYRDAVPEELWKKLATISVSAQTVAHNPKEAGKRREFVAKDLLECSVSEIGG